jgi:FkbM family methyltransferase
MNLSAISDKSLLGKILRFPLRLIPPQTVWPIMQGRLKGKKWIVGSSNHGCWVGSYEYAKRIVFERTVRENSVIFDLGAHAGFYTLLASVLVGPRGKVFAFEPFPRNLVYLKEHLRLNNIHNVTVVEAAVSDKCGTAFFDEGPSSSQGHIFPNGRLQVETVAMDELVASRKLPTPDYIKIDIEGTEALALSGAKSMLAQSHPTIFLATHGSSVHQECCRLLRSLDYELRPIDGTNVESSDEILATYNAGQTEH